MTHSSGKTWSLINKLVSNPTTIKDHENITDYEIVHQVLLNMKPEQTIKRDVIKTIQRNESVNESYFTLTDQKNAISINSNRNQAQMISVMSF